MFDFLSKAGGTVMDTVGDVASSVGNMAQTGLTHTFEKLQDPEFQQQLGLLSAVMSDDQNRYQGALNAYDTRRAEIAKQKREDMQRAESRQWKLEDAKRDREWSTEDRDMGYSHDFKKLEVQDGYQTTRDKTLHQYGLEDKAVDHSYGVARDNNTHNNNLSRDSHQQTIRNQDTVFNGSDHESQKRFISGVDYEAAPENPEVVTVNPGIEQGTVQTTEIYKIPSGLSRSGQDATVEVTKEQPVEQVAPQALVTQQQHPQPQTPTPRPAKGDYSQLQQKEGKGDGSDQALNHSITFQSGRYVQIVNSRGTPITNNKAGTSFVYDSETGNSTWITANPVAANAAAIQANEGLSVAKDLETATEEGRGIEYSGGWKDGLWSRKWEDFWGGRATADTNSQFETMNGAVEGQILATMYVENGGKAVTNDQLNAEKKRIGELSLENTPEQNKLVFDRMKAFLNKSITAGDHANKQEVGTVDNQDYGNHGDRGSRMDPNQPNKQPHNSGPHYKNEGKIGVDKRTGKKFRIVNGYPVAID